jgi:biotin transport system substrate-specific component
MSLSTQELTRAAVFTAIMCILTVLVRLFEPVVVVPFSLQPLVMLLTACFLTPRGAALSMLAYVLLGLFGLPVFSLPPYGGPAYLFIPSFGFVLGFPLAAWVQSRLIKRPGLSTFIFSGIAGILTLYAIGLPYLYFILNFYLGHTVDVSGVLQIALLPFIGFDLLKVVAASLLALEMGRRFNIKREL